MIQVKRGQQHAEATIEHDDSQSLYVHKRYLAEFKKLPKYYYTYE